ncbi:MAG: ATP synthase subunit I [Pseudomonadota bacterium]|jgi:ATP synthase protein I
MFRAVILQIGATLVTAAIAGLLAGPHGAVSAALGGAACFLPNLLFALRLSAASKKPGGAPPAAFFVGEFIKIAATIVLLAMAAILYRDLQWLALLAGLIVALKANLLAFTFRS